MAFPKTFEEFKNAGYEYDGEGICRGCGATILWYITPVKRKKIPIDADGAAAHWSTCPKAEQFKQLRGRRQHQEAQ